jgi:hypothetical protein
LQKIGTISDSVFSGNSVSAGNNISSGVVIGAYSGIAKVGGVDGRIAGNIISGNTIASTDTGTAWTINGGVIYLPHSATFADNQITHNAVSVAHSGGKIYGIVTIDTGNNQNYTGSGVIGAMGTTGDVVLNVTASAGNTALSQGNTVSGGADADLGGANSLAFRPVNYGNGTTSTSSRNTMLNVTAAFGGSVEIYDPIYVAQNNGKTFTMNVSGASDFLWGGVNKIDMTGVDSGMYSIPSRTNGGAASVNFVASSKTTLLAGFQLNDLTKAAWDNLATPAKKLTVNLNPGANLTVQRDSRMDVASASLNGNLIFDLAGISKNNESAPVH